MTKHTIDEDILETMLEAAYRRGAAWVTENATSAEYLGKAARDYADATIAETFRLGVTAPGGGGGVSVDGIKITKLDVGGAKSVPIVVGGPALCGGSTPRQLGEQKSPPIGGMGKWG